MGLVRTYGPDINAHFACIALKVGCVLGDASTVRET
jgi:hypothetical protein